MASVGVANTASGNDVALGVGASSPHREEVFGRGFPAVTGIADSPVAGGVSTPKAETPLRRVRLEPGLGPPVHYCLAARASRFSMSFWYSSAMALV